MLSAVEDMGIKAEIMEVHAALAAVRSSIYPQIGHDDWRANLPGDPIMPRSPQQRQKRCVGYFMATDIPAALHY